jgi:hypothetical protein
VRTSATRQRPQRRLVSTPARGRHGLSPAEFDVILAAQGGVCPICGRVADRWDVDHDHVLAMTHGHDPDVGCKRCVRAILCRQDNSMLGFAGDDADRLRAAAAYLDHYRRAS